MAVPPDTDVYLETVETAEDPAKKAKGLGLAGVGSLRGEMCIRDRFYVEDDPQIADTVKGYLEQKGIRVRICLLYTSITGAIGGAVAAMSGAAFLCYCLLYTSNDIIEVVG